MQRCINENPDIDWLNVMGIQAVGSGKQRECGVFFAD
jgi:hypothetical protein